MTRRLGNRNEEMVAWFYKHQNYNCWMPHWVGRRKYNIFRSSDIFRLFDGIAIREDQIVLFQVKTAKYFLKEVETEIKDFICPESLIKDYWVIEERQAKVRRFSLGKQTDYIVDLNTMEIINA